MAEGGAMLRDLIATAWARSRQAKAPDAAKVVDFLAEPAH